MEHKEEGTKGTLHSRIKDVFDKCDDNKKGYLTVDEFGKLQDLLVQEQGYDAERVCDAFQAMVAPITLADVTNALTLPSRALHERRSSSPSAKISALARFGFSTAEQMIPAARIILVLQLARAKLESDKTLRGDIDWCIEQIALGKIYESVLLNPDGGERADRSPRRTQAMPWLSQFSTQKVTQEEMQSYLYETRMRLLELGAEQHPKKDPERAKRRSVMAQDLARELQERTVFLKTVDLPSFDILEAERVLTREKLLPTLAYHIFEHHGLFGRSALDENAFVAFISAIRKGYLKDVPYHNDLHAADVLQMCHFLLVQGGVAKTAQLSALDIAAYLIAAIIHDFRHPGVTNGFLQNSANDLALAYNDHSILENYHVSEAFKIILKEPGCNLFQNLTPNERNIVRRRIINCVLATDMRGHHDMATKLQNLITIHGIHKGKHSEKIINPKSLFDNQQFILEVCIHFADCSNPCRVWDTHKELGMRLYEEFGRQGDIEKSMKLPISFLCDRTTVNPPISQIGYISGVVKPLLSKLVDIFPRLSPLWTLLCKNEQTWRKMGI
jgi:cAMP-specific phosphodiesterase 4